MSKQLYYKLNITFLYLLILAIIGTYLRFMFIYDPGILKFSNLLHAHSHVAMLGWIYNVIFISILYTFLPKSINNKKYNIIFWVTQLSIFGMLFSFAAQGYAAVSISFSALHIIISYMFIYSFVRDYRNNNIEKSISIKFIYGGLFFLFFSSFGPLGLAVITANGFGGTDLYKQAIYFYLHFQYNGWFVFSLIGLWLSVSEKDLNNGQKKKAGTAFKILFISNFPAYFLSLLGFKIHTALWIIAFISGLFQLIGFRKLFKVLFSSEKSIFLNANSWFKLLFRISFLLLLTKYILQFISSLPEAGSPAFISREVAIGYIHLVMLGVITLGMTGWLSYYNIIQISTGGIKIFLSGFILNEIILFYPSFIIWFHGPVFRYYNILLFVCSLLMLIGVIFIFKYLFRRPF